MARKVMKARVKATGNVVDVELSHYIGDEAWYTSKCQVSYSENELEFIDDPKDYWERLRHQAAIAAMQGVLANADLLFSLCKNRSDCPVKVVAIEFATACADTFVERMKEE